tara:strand:- start:1205 stop:1531 length:327 start_codon:yes stop_codon:yes gene_type:complete
MAYSVKTFLSNMGMSVYLGDRLKLPLGNDDDENIVQEMLRQIVSTNGSDVDDDEGNASRNVGSKEKLGVKKKKRDANESDVSDDSDDELNGNSSHKKRRKKRGKGGKK